MLDQWKELKIKKYIIGPSLFLIQFCLTTKLLREFAKLDGIKIIFLGV
jgi:hypothetical protein